MAVIWYEDMNRLLPIGIAAFIAASLGIFFLGDSGLSAFGGLSRYEQGLEANVESLKQRNQDLQAELTRLKSDPQSVRVLAHGIGLYAPGETVVKLVGRPPKPESYAVGDLLRLRRPEPTGNVLFKETALGVVAAALIAALFAAAARRKANASSRR
jgi:cell division protein FtsB